jgi:hypothetical protein
MPSEYDCMRPGRPGIPSGFCTYPPLGSHVFTRDFVLSADLSNQRIHTDRQREIRTAFRVFPIAMDATILPSATAMSPDAVSSQQQRSALVRAGDSNTSPTSKLHVAPWPQSAFSESLKNSHVRGAASLLRPQVDAQPQSSRGHKRSATGEIKAVVHHQNRRHLPSNGLNGHSRTASVDSNGNRIAEVSD